MVVNVSISVKTIVILIAMNYTAVKLGLSSLQTSPLFFRRHLVGSDYFRDVRAHRFFSQFYVGDSNVDVRKCSFSRMLGSSFSLKSYNSVFGKTSLNQGNRYLISETLFVNISISGRGPAIEIDNSAAVAVITSCTFFRCVGTAVVAHNAGAISAYNSQSVTLKALCFEMCSANSEPCAYQISSHNCISTVYTRVELISEFRCGQFTVASYFPSFSGSNLDYWYMNNNCSFNHLNSYGGGGIGLARMQNNFIIHNQVISIIANSMTSCNTVSKFIQINNTNFLNNSCSTCWAGFISSSNTLEFCSCIFKENKASPIYSALLSSSSGSVVFSQCCFDYEIIESHRGQTVFNSCLFAPSDCTTIPMSLLNTNMCWVSISCQPAICSYPILHKFSLVVLRLMMLAPLLS